MCKHAFWEGEAEGIFLGAVISLISMVHVGLVSSAQRANYWQVQ